MKGSGCLLGLLISLVMMGSPAWGETYKVSMKNRMFTPETLTIKAGETVEWINDDEDVHQVISGKDLQDPSLAKPLDGGTLLPGQYYIFKFEKPGKYPYMCVIHWSLQSITGKGGMIGEVVVEP